MASIEASPGGLRWALVAINRCELGQIQTDELQLETAAGQQPTLTRVPRPTPEQQGILNGLGLPLPQRLSPERCW